MTVTAAVPVETRVLEWLACEALSHDPSNPRTDLGDLAELAASIRAVGVLEPLIVRPTADPDRWMIVAGHRRHAAAMDAGLRMVPCVILTDLADDAEAVALMLVENLQRTDLHPLEEAHAYRRLLDLGWAQSDIASRTGRSAATVSKRVRLLDLPDDIRRAVRTGRVGVETAYELEKALRTDGIDTDALLAEARQVLEDEDAVWADEDIAARARTMTRQAESDRARLAKISEAEAAGFQPLNPAADAPSYTSNSEDSPRRIGGWWGGIDVDYDEHRPEPCSRFTVAPRRDSVDLEWWCVDWRRHLPEGDSPVKASTEWLEEQDRRRTGAPAPMSREEKAREAARRARWDFYAETVTDLGKAGEKPKQKVSRIIYQQAVLHLLGVVTSAELNSILELTGVEFKRSSNLDTKRDLFGDVFRDDPVTATLALVLVRGEDWRLTSGNAGFAAQFLRLLGYEGPIVSDDRLDLEGDES